MKSRFQMVCGVFLGLALGACSEDKDPVNSDDAGIVNGGDGGGPTTGGPGVGMCPAMCPTGQTCDAATGQCKPAGMCPCTTGNHCDVATNTCMPGCETNSDCKMGEMCDSATGTCSPGCAGTLVPGLALSKVELNQAVPVLLAKDGVAPPSAMRTAPVVQNRPAIVRAFVTPEAGYAMGTNVTAVLKVDAGMGEKKFTAAKVVAAASTDAALDSTLNIELPADAITATSKFSLELTQDACASAASPKARFPASGTQALDAQKTGALKVMIVPNEVAPNKLDVSAPAIQAIKDGLFALYPVESVEITVHAPVPADAAVTLQKLLQTTRALRLAEKPAADMYYMGLLTSKATFREACPMGCVAGISTLGGAGASGNPDDRYGVALGYLSDTAVMSGTNNTTEKAITVNEIARQLGHAHGRPNSPCGTPLPENIDTAFPNMNNAAIDGVGYHLVAKTVATPELHKDLMGFCMPSWIHSYTYNQLATRVKAVSGVVGPYKVPGPATEYTSVVVQSNGQHFWGDSFTSTDAPSGEFVLARAFDASGNVVSDDVAVTLTELSEASDVLATFPAPAANWAAVEINGQLVPVH